MGIAKDLILGLTEPLAGLVSEFIVDKDKAAELAHRIQTLASENAHELLMANFATNIEEARSGSLFRGGWRPFVGWTCGAGMALNFVFMPIFGPLVEAYTTVVMDPLDLTTMMPILIGMLGFGGMRAFEKTKGVG